AENKKLYAMIFLVSSENNSSQHLRFLAHIVEMADNKNFLKDWRNAENKTAIRQLMLRDERFISFTIRSSNRTKSMIGKQVKELDLPEESLISIIKCENDIKIPHGNT